MENAKKIFIQRDYSLGTAVRFSTDFPRELTGKVLIRTTCSYVSPLPKMVDETTYRGTIDQINLVFEGAEDLNCHAYTEGCLACLTGYTIHYCFKTRYERSVEEVARYIRQQNQEIYQRHGIIIGDPMDRGLRCIEVKILQETETQA